MSASAHAPAGAPAPAPVYGLVLAGGRSTRMQRDKATLAYHGKTQLEWAMELIEPLVVRAFVSVRPDQTRDPVRSKYPQVVDTHENLGPIAGILAAQAAHPEVAWLVLACDLPFLDSATLQHLLWARQPDRMATAYRSSHDGLPEPLCAIYEPHSREAIAAYVAGGKQCPRKFLIQSDAHLLEEPNPRALDNVNTPEEYGSAMNTLASPENRPSAANNSKTVRVQYFALLREQAGRSDESVVTHAGTPRELYDELRARYPFSLGPEMLRVAVNTEFADWSQPLKDGDAVVFIPPVAGG
ncbi:MAG: NTP transferase domain-containing protein [Steroidobacteraceae bacterium]|nr:NTP transferase domain-containing protein [Steroidobacteraceae bacterium]